MSDRRRPSLRGARVPSGKLRGFGGRVRVYVQYNPLKVYFIKEKIADGGSSTVYRCGPLIDLCLGPHVANTNRIKAFAVYKVRVSRGRGNSGMPEGTAVVPASRRPIHS